MSLNLSNNLGNNPLRQVRVRGQEGVPQSGGSSSFLSVGTQEPCSPPTVPKDPCSQPGALVLSKRYKQGQGRSRE